MNIIHDKLPHPAEETQPPFSLISNSSPTALKELLLLFCCILSSAHFIFVLMFIDPWPQHKYCGRVVEGWRWERTQDRDGRELLMAWIWRVLGFTTGAQPAISSMAKPEDDQPSLVLCSRRITAPTSVSDPLSVHADCNRQDQSDPWTCLSLQGQ